MKKVEKIVLPLITFAVVLLTWQLIVWAKLFPEYLLPSPLAVWNGSLELLTNKTLFEHIGYSLYRILMGYGLAVITAIPLGLIFGWYSRLWTAIDPFVQVLRPVSPLAWSPLLILWFSLETSPIVIIFIASFFPILLSTVAAVRNVDPIYLKVARNFGASNLDILRKIVVPASFPYITTGLHIALGAAWIHVIAGEMLGVRSGLGYMIIDARNTIRYDQVITGIIIIGLLGLTLDRLISLAERFIKKQWGLEQNV